MFSMGQMGLRQCERVSDERERRGHYILKRGCLGRHSCDTVRMVGSWSADDPVKKQRQRFEK